MELFTSPCITTWTSQLNYSLPDLSKTPSRCKDAMSVTQVSVERLFSALKLFKTDHRNKLKEDILDALLFLRANKEQYLSISHFCMLQIK